MKLIKNKYFISIFSILIFIFLLKQVILFSINSQGDSFSGKLSNIFYSQYLKFGGKTINKLFYYNPQWFFPKKSDIILNFSKNDIIYNDSIIDVIKTSGTNIVSDDLKLWRKSNLIFNNNKVKIKYKFHASSIDQYVNGSQSYSVKSKEKIFNKKEFKLISSIDANYKNIFINYLSKHFNLISEDPGIIVALKTHRKVQDYFMYEKFDENFLEKNYKLSNPFILRNLTFNEGYNSSSWHSSEFDDVTYNIDSEYIDKNQYNKWEKLLKFDFEDIELDKNYIARYFSLLYLFGHPHHITGNNDKWVISDEGLFPVFRNEGNIVRLSEIGFDFNNSLFNNMYYSKTIDKYKEMLIDKNIFNSRNMYLQNIVKKEKFIMSSFDSIFESNEDKHRRFNDNYFYVKNFHTQLKKVLSDNIAFIKKYLNSGFIMVMKKNDSLHIVSTRNNKLEIFLEKATYEMYPKTYFLDESVIKSIKNEIKIKVKNNISDLKFIDKVTNDTIYNESSKIHFITVD